MVLALSAVTAFSAVPAAMVTAAGNPYPTTRMWIEMVYMRSPAHALHGSVCMTDRESHCLHGEMR